MTFVVLFLSSFMKIDNYFLVYLKIGHDQFLSRHSNRAIYNCHAFDAIRYLQTKKHRQLNQYKITFLETMAWFM
jgi:hypothetical protein